jgi:tetratricopeptide (TPR) repeat protein
MAMKKGNWRVFIFVLPFLACHFLVHSFGADSRANRYFNVADRAILIHDYQNAIDLYFKGMTLYQGLQSASGRKMQTRIWDDIGFAYLQLGDLKKAEENLKKALSFHPYNYNALFYLAVTHLQDENFEAAKQELVKIENDVFFDDSWTIDADMFRKKTGKILDSDELARIKNEKGVFLERLSENEVIVHLWAFDEKNEGAFYYAQGIVNRESGELEEAERKFRAAREALYDDMDPGSKIKLHHMLIDHDNNLLVEWHNMFFKVLKEGRIKEAIYVLVNALDVDVQSFVINLNLALTCYDVAKLEDYDSDFLAMAEKYCARAIWVKDFTYVSTPHEVGAHDLMGNIYYYQKRFVAAKEEFLRALHIDPSEPYVHFNLGQAYYILSDWVQASEEWKRAIELEKTDIKSKEKGEKDAKGELQYIVTVERKPISHLAHMSLGMLYKKQDLNEKALAHFEEAVAIEPENAEPYLELGKIYQMEGDTEKALECYEKYLYLGGKKIEETQKLIDSLKKE